MIRKSVELIREGCYAAEVQIELIEDDRRTGNCLIPDTLVGRRERAQIGNMNRLATGIAHRLCQ